ncbi:choline transporter-like protein 1 [Aethina tumida]|uniref:choline transporter-like protein 1 n=1 Tax=Aethina tumida TaxID=116153 RepID=UPI00096AE597|nr:choline transporter-like protein 1 [Aethina tumida]XP_049819770.1 choline transporter-like protein 1 [Aethina tumida]XP_049819771.1 choline transporter-like protein 1 [Aethina tumida]
MGSTLSVTDKVAPGELSGLKQSIFNRSDSELSDEQRHKSRTTTDVFFLLLFTTFLIILLCFIGYCVFYGDIYRSINGYDNCGNVCNRPGYTVKTGERRDPGCFGYNHINEKYHIVVKHNSLVDRHCVANCSQYEGYRQFFNRCVPKKSSSVVNTVFSKTGLKNFFQEVAEDFHFCWPEFCYLCLVALAASILILFLFRYLIGLVVWVVLIGVVIACIGGTIFLWIMWKQSTDQANFVPDNLIPDVDSRKTGTYLGFAIAATIVSIMVVLVIFVMRKRIKLVVQLFEESGKALTAMPLLLIEPILTFICLAIVITLWFYFSLWIESSGYLTEQRSHVFYYEKNSWMRFTRWYNLLAMLWMTQFLIGCQHMVIAGAVSEWFFTRDKSKLSFPISHSAYNLVRFHLGSVALGSLIIALVQFLRIIFKVLEKYLNNHEGSIAKCLMKCCHCCLYCFEKVIKYLSRNAYIEVAIYGYSFCTAGKQAFKLLSSNVLRVATINSVGDFILFLGKILVVVTTVLVGIKLIQDKDGVHHMWVPITLAGLFAYFVAHCFMTVYEMSIDTIFLCFCEDCEQNDGVTRPYYMSRGLMEFVENSRKALEIHDHKQQNKVNSAWQDDIHTISKSVGDT